MNEIKDHIAQINQLCDAHDVRSLYAFGSVVSGNLKPDSDIDLIVDIITEDPIDYSENYFAIKFQLQDILNRPIDLLENKAIRNTFLIKQIDNTKMLVYGG